MAGTPYDIVVLSSSPPEARHVAAPRHLSPITAPDRRVAMPTTSSGPLSPLPNPEGPAPGALRSGSRAARVPEGVSRGFATARSLLADIDISDVGLSAIEQAIEARRGPTGPEDTIKATKPRKPRAKKVVDGEAAAEKPKAKRGRKPKASNTEQSQRDALNTEGAAATTSSHFAKSPVIDAAAEQAAPPPEPKTVKARKPRAKKAAAGGGEIQTTIPPAKVMKPRAPRKTMKKAQEKAAEVVSAHFRSRDASVDAAAPQQHQLATTTEGGRPAVGEETTWDVPASPSARSRGPPKQKPPDFDPNMPLDLDAAVDRRRDWTPPPDTVRQDILTSSTSKENHPGTGGTDGASFSGLLSGFSYAQLDVQSEQQAARTTSVEAAGVTKRRRVDLIDVSNDHGASRQASPEKGKAPKKKPRTITDLVTGQYAPPPVPESPQVTSDFFARRTPTATKTTKVPLNDTTNGELSKANKKPVRKRSASKEGSEKAAAKPRTKKGSAKAAAKPKPVAEKLLSPTSAAFRMNRQEVLFGTSSQLALDESPTMVREIQHAIRESEQDADSRESMRGVNPAGDAWPRLKRLEGRRALWRASSRDDEGGMLEKKSVYLPEPDRTQDFPLLIDGTCEPQKFDKDGEFLDIDHIELPPEPKPDDSFLDIDDFPPPQPTSTNAPITISSDLPTPPPTVTEFTTEFTSAAKKLDVHSSPFYDIDDFPRDANPPPSGQDHDNDNSFFDIDDYIPQPELPPPSTSGSPVKKRRGRPPKSQLAIPTKPPASAPIPAVAKVPASTSRPASARPSAKPSAASSISASAKLPPPSSHPSSAPPRTPRQSDRFTHIDEILDSEDDAALSPTPPRIHLPTSPLPLSLCPSPSKPRPQKPPSSPTPIFSIPISYLTFETLRPTLFAAITRLVRSLPPSNDPSNPSWYEKILMYDAIGVEEFTGWLAGFGEEGVGVWKRAGKGQVRGWEKVGGVVVEVRGRDNGGKVGGEDGMKSGGDEEMVIAVRKEVEPWMVQRWCEESSVCVVSREKKSGSGGARRGLY